MFPLSNSTISSSMFRVIFVSVGKYLTPNLDIFELSCLEYEYLSANLHLDTTISQRVIDLC